jgi:alpha-tubulin suppressor-like RCC1 family protein
MALLLSVGKSQAQTVSLATALDTGTTLTWTDGGHGGVVGQKIVSHDGEDAVEMGGETSWVATGVRGPGLVVFWSKVSQSSDGIWLFMDQEFADLYDNTEWVQRQVFIPEGTHLLLWMFNSWGDGQSPGKGWLDEVKYYPGRTNALPIALDDEFLQASSGNADWFEQRAVSHDRRSSARSGKISHGEHTSASVRVTGPGTIDFWWKVSSEKSRDILRFESGYREPLTISGEINWQRVKMGLPEGDHDLTWTYEKNHISSKGQDAGWVDEITFTPAAPPVIVSQPGDITLYEGIRLTLQVRTEDLSILNYEWYRDGNLVEINDGTFVTDYASTGHSGIYRVKVINGFFETWSKPFKVTVLPRIESKIAMEGADVMLEFKTTGIKDPSVVWDNGMALAQNPRAIGVNKKSLYIINAQPEDSGTYVVSVRDQIGNQFTVVGQLSVLPRGNVLVHSPNFHGQGEAETLRPPEGLTDVKAIALGSLHCVALKGDGTVVVWGRNLHGEVLVPEGISNVVKVAAGGGISYALKADGRIAAWGIQPRASQASTLTDIVDISAGGSLLALKKDGTVMQLYDDGNWVSAPEGVSNVVAIAAGNGHNLALKRGGTVLAWGNNDYGQADVPVGLRNVSAIAAGVYQSIALLTNGRVIIWGTNNLGSAHAASLNPPRDLKRAIAVSAGYDFSILDKDSQVVQWGSLGRFRPVGFPPVAALSTCFNEAFLIQVPVVVKDPTNQTVVTGQNIAFTTTAVGRHPLSYQWRFKGSNIRGATNSTYTVTNAQERNAGGYSVEVTNPFGRASSKSGKLTVVQP